MAICAHHRKLIVSILYFGSLFVLVGHDNGCESRPEVLQAVLHHPCAGVFEKDK